jgi:thiol:disulfide interchange protein DsbD
VAYIDGTFDVLVAVSVSDAVPAGEHAVGLHVAYTLCSPGMCRFMQADLQVTLAVSAAAAMDAASPSAPAPAAPEAAGGDPFAGHSPVVVVLLAFLLGLGLTLTPCVYPLIPVTVGIVGATSGKGRLDGFVRSLVYVLGISITYSAVGVAAAATGGLFGQIAHSPVVYVALAAIFAVLAGGMFDFYTIGFSSQRLQRLQAALRGKAGLAGILVIGMLSGAAATACIAPVIAAALGYVAASGSLLLGWLIFFAMAWGIGTPLILVGTFAGLAKSLPKSGPWMVAVKRVLGLILLACAGWFLIKSGLLTGL